MKKVQFETDLEEFMKNVTIEDKMLSNYEDVKGNYFEINTGNLIARCDYLEFSKEKIGENGASEYEQALFSKLIDNIPYKEKKIKRIVPKSEITGKEEDNSTLTEKVITIVEVWNVSNPYGASKSFNNKNDALKFVKGINENIKTVTRQ